MEETQMDVETTAIYERLIKIAKDSDITNYSVIAPLARLDMNLPPHRNRISDILDEISRTESSCGRPLLSAVVILKDENIPGDGFFKMARELRLYDDDDDFRFWIRELRRVHDYWSAHQ